MEESPFTLLRLGENEFLVNYLDETSGPELKKLAEELIKQFLIFDPGIEFFTGIFDNSVVCAAKPETALWDLDYVETGRNAEIKLWINPHLGLRVDIKNFDGRVLEIIFMWAARIPCLFSSPLR